MTRAAAHVDCVQENCADLRNSKVIDIVRELRSHGADVFVPDAWADADEAMHAYNVPLLRWEELPRAEAIVAAVSHHQYAQLTADRLQDELVPGGAFIDVKAQHEAAALRAAGYTVWRL